MKKLLEILSKPLVLIGVIISIILIFIILQTPPIYSTYKMNSSDKKREESINQSLTYLKAKESFRPYLYKCAAGAVTIGYGDTSFHKEYPNVQKISEELASERLQDKITEHYDYLNNLTVQDTETGHFITYTQFLNYKQLTALISFIYNTGESGFAKSTLKKHLDKKILLYLQHQYPAGSKAPSKLGYQKSVNKLDKLIEVEINKWIMVKANLKYQKSKGLETRRKEEAAMLIRSKIF